MWIKNSGSCGTQFLVECHTAGRWIPLQFLNKSLFGLTNLFLSPIRYKYTYYNLEHIYSRTILKKDISGQPDICFKRRSLNPRKFTLSLCSRSDQSGTYQWFRFLIFWKERKNSSAWFIGKQRLISQPGNRKEWLRYWLRKEELKERFKFDFYLESCNSNRKNDCSMWFINRRRVKHQ